MKTFKCDNCDDNDCTLSVKDCGVLTPEECSFDQVSDWKELKPKEEMKRYRLVIPEMISKDDIIHFNLFIKHDGCEVDMKKLMVYSDNGWIHIRSTIPNEWLHEIEEEKPKRPID